ncbi:unnamed protein product [Aphanomyces euteiches]
MQVGIPLPLNYFKCPPLSQREIMKAKLEGGTYDWNLLKDESELKIYKGRCHGTTEDAVLHCGVMEVIGELNECMELHQDDTTEQAREFTQKFGRAYADAMTLYTVLPRHPT